MRRAFLGLGGNIGEPLAAMGEALRHLDRRADMRVLDVSRAFRTPPWGKTDQPWFLNCCAAIETAAGAELILDACLAVERSLKRERRERWGPRTLDIDVLVLEGARHASERLTVPHPRMTARAFVLVPLADIAPDLVVENRTVAEWLDGIDASGITPATPRRDWWREP